MHDRLAYEAFSHGFDAFLDAALVDDCPWPSEAPPGIWWHLGYGTALERWAFALRPWSSMSGHREDSSSPRIAPETGRDHKDVKGHRVNPELEETPQSAG